MPLWKHLSHLKQSSTAAFAEVLLFCVVKYEPSVDDILIQGDYFVGK